LLGGINLYGYVGGNPVNRSDPKGLAYDLVDPAFFAWSLADFAKNPGFWTGLELCADTVSLLPGVPSIGWLTKADNVYDLSKGAKKFKKGPDFVVTESGVVIPKDPKALKNNLDTAFQDASTNPSTSKKFVGEDAQGPLRARVEKAHPSDPNFTGTPDALHTVDHIHIDRRKNTTSGPWKSKEKTNYDWPF